MEEAACSQIPHSFNPNSVTLSLHGLGQQFAFQLILSVVKEEYYTLFIYLIGMLDWLIDRYKVLRTYKNAKCCYY